MLRTRSGKRAVASRPFMTEGAPAPRNAATYGARLRAEQSQRAFGQAGPPPQWALDKAAEHQLTGGYSRKRNPICPSCGVMRSTAGGCYC